MLTLAGILAALSGKPVAGLFALVAAVVALIGMCIAIARFRRDYRRSAPVFEAQASPIPNWPGWHQVRVTVRNTGISGLKIDATSPGLLRWHKVAPYNALTLQDAYGNATLPQSPPDQVEPLNLLDLTARPGAERPLKLWVLVGPRQPGKTPPRRLTVLWHWADQPNKIRTTRLRF